jgi:Tol biopolymer transport system component
VAVAGGAPRFLDLSGNGYAPSWSPDEKSIALASDAGGDLDIYVVSPDGEPQARIRRPGADRNPAWIQRTVGTG